MPVVIVTGMRQTGKTTFLCSQPQLRDRSYFSFDDFALASYLARLELSSSIRNNPLYGAILETYAAQNLLSILSAKWPNASLYFWTVQGRHEVDFVIAAGRSCIALELKPAARWQARDLAGLKAFLAATPQCKAGILCHNGEHAVGLEQKLWALPISLVIS